MAVPFPDSPFYRGAEAPCRFEAEIYDCIVYGKIPECIDGTFYRVMPDAQYAPKFSDDVFINGDGQIDGTCACGAH
jgi:carotenoid cleavage dioxygenase-like enzyme